MNAHVDSLLLTGSGLTEFAGAIGSLGGSFSSGFDFGGVSLGDGISLDVRAPSMPNGRIETDLDDIEGSLPNVIREFSPSFDGSLSATVLADIPLLGANLDFDLSFPDLNAFFQGVALKVGRNGEDIDNPSEAGNLAFTISQLDADALTLITEFVDLPDLATLILGGDQLDLFISAFE